jgi:hypothetical protein
MTVEQSGAEASPAPEAPREEAPREEAGEAAAKPDLDETKRKFREALERKRRTHATAESADHTGKVHGAHGPAASRRSFRRKSG